MTQLDGPLVFPVGHYHGYAPHDAGEVDHLVWRGGKMLALTSDMFEAWDLLHPPSAWPANDPWTTPAMRHQARWMGLDDAEPYLALFRRNHLLAEVWPGTAETRDAARRLRLHPTMVGLGNTAPDATEFGIEFDFRLKTAWFIKVSRTVFELWRWAPAVDNLWDLCLFHTDRERANGATDPERTDPDTVLTGLLYALGKLLAERAAYLDLSESPDAR